MLVKSIRKVMYRTFRLSFSTNIVCPKSLAHFDMWVFHDNWTRLIGHIVRWPDHHTNYFNCRKYNIMYCIFVKCKICKQKYVKNVYVYINCAWQEIIMYKIYLQTISVDLNLLTGLTVLYMYTLEYISIVPTQRNDFRNKYWGFRITLQLFIMFLMMVSTDFFR